MPDHKIRPGEIIAGTITFTTQGHTSAPAPTSFQIKEINENEIIVQLVDDIEIVWNIYSKFHISSNEFIYMEPIPDSVFWEGSLTYRNNRGNGNRDIVILCKLKI